MRKGFGTADEVQAFLQPRLKSLSDPFLLPNMKAAVTRILAALDRRERIVLFGDYDVDGVTSLALLAETLRAYGAIPDLFLPSRMEEGYGLSHDSVQRSIQQFHPQLLIALDCGTSSGAEIVDLRKRGVEVIVLDHHEPKSAAPECVAVVNPKVDPGSPFHYLCSVGIVFKLCHALLKTRPIDLDLKSKLDLVALGTVADIVPLRGENRTLVQRGAIEIARSTRPGLKKLIEVSGVKPPIFTEDIGYRLGPRLNAAGRLSTGEKSLRLLLAQDGAEATELAELLDRQNRERQEGEKRIFAAAAEKSAKEFDPSRGAASGGVARDLLSDEDLQPRLRLDHEISFAELNFDFLGWHEMLQPFGNGNPQPLFLARGVESVAVPRIVGEKHLQLRLRQHNYHQRAIFFGAAADALPKQPWDIAFRIRADEYEGETRLEMRVEAVREAAPTT